MLTHERFERLFHVRPPRRVVPGSRLRMIVHRHAAAFHVLDVRIDDGGRIQRIAAAVDREERLVAQVVRKQETVVYVPARQHHQVAVERQEACERRRFVHGDVVGAGAAVRHARDDHAILVHVVEPLRRVDDRDEVQHLILAPPRSVGPRVRDDVNLLGARQGPDRAGSDRRVGPSPSDAAVQMDAHLITAARIVGVRHVQGVVMLDAVRCAILEPNDAGPLRGVGSAPLQAAIGFVEPDAGSNNAVHERGGFIRRCRGPERIERDVDRRCLRSLMAGRRRHQRARDGDDDRDVSGHAWCIT